MYIYIYTYAFCDRSTSPKSRVLWSTGAQKRAHLDAVVLEQSAGVSTIEKEVQGMDEFTEKLLGHPIMKKKDVQISVFRLGEALGMDASDSNTSLMANLAVDLATSAGKVEMGAEASGQEWLQEEFPVKLILKRAFFSLKTLEDSLGKMRAKLQATQKQIDRIQKGQAGFMDRKGKALKRALACLDPDEAATTEHLARRNARNRQRKGIREEKMRKKRSQDDVYKNVKPKVKRRDRLSIYDKVKIVEFAEKLLQEAPLHASRCNARNSGQGLLLFRHRENFRRGINLQSRCQQEFPNLGKIKVCVLIRRCKEQSWKTLSTEQQKKYYQLPDDIKVALGRTEDVKGWKSIGYEALHESVKQKGTINRWNVPGPVLEDFGLPNQ